MMTGSPTSPTVRRWELAARLRRLRLDAGMTVEQVAEHLLCSPAKISRLETAVRGAGPRDVRDLCLLYAVTDDERDRLMSLAREAKERSWWQEYSALETPYSTYIGLEAAASSILELQPLHLPGLLQTAEYARALQRGVRPEELFPDQDVEERVAVKLRRQALLADSPRSLHFLVDEAAIHREVLEPELMAAQIGHLVEMSRAPRITLQIIPSASGAYPGIVGGFIVLRFDESLVSDAVYLEGLPGELFLDRPDDVSRFTDVFEFVASRVALSPADSRQLLERMRDG